MIVEICVGSSCHLKGSHEIVELFKKEIADRNLGDEITLAGCFCKGKCNRDGVTISVDDVCYTGITPEGFGKFFKENILGEA